MGWETATFWQSPPWQPVHTGHRLGARRLPLADWLPSLLQPGEQDRKRQLLAAAYAALPNTQAQQQQAADAVLVHLAATKDRLATKSQTINEPPLVTAALQVPDDLCLLQRNQDDTAFELIAGVVCAPSYWRLSDKLGLKLSAIHAPVPGLNAQLGSRIDQFLQRMPSDSVFERHNFFVHAQAEPYQVEPDEFVYQTSNHDAWWLRTERQQFRRLDNQLLLFSIRVRLFEFAELREYPMAQQSLRQHLQVMSPAQIDGFGGPEKWGQVCLLLDNWLEG